MIILTSLPFYSTKEQFTSGTRHVKNEARESRKAFDSVTQPLKYLGIGHPFKMFRE